MPLVLIGISHHSAPVALRERLVFGPEEQRRLLTDPATRQRADVAGVTEFALLSTCNRTELWAAGRDGCHRFLKEPRGLLEFLAGLSSLDVETLRAHTYTRIGADAVRHLCRVAAGIESMVLGESEILGQVSHAHELAARVGTLGPLLQEALHTAVRAGRRARTETGICRRPSSVSSEAVRLLAEVGGPLDGQAVLIVGTGKMGRLAGEVLRSHRVRRLTVVSRTTQHAKALATSWGATALPWHELAGAIRAADAVICSTGAPHAVVSEELVRSAIGADGDGRRRVFMDIAVPRDVEAAVAALPGIELYDMDALQGRLDGNLELRRQEVPAVTRIIEEEVARFEEWRNAATLRPLLVQMRARSEAIRRREVDRAIRHLGDVSPEVRAQIEALSESLVSKLLHEPTRRLRAASDPERARTLTRVTRELFGLDELSEEPPAGESVA
jgi:glutamyl-tRNA reductase